MDVHQFDLLIHAERVFCAASGLDGPGAVAVRGDRIVAAGSHVAGSAREVLEFPDAMLLPGLVDMHGHPGRGDSKYDVDPDLHFLPRGVTTALSQGDAGAANWPGYRDTVIETARTRVRLAINLCVEGESNPEMEAFNSRFKSEGRSLFLVAQSVTELAMIVTERMEYHNTQRRHSSIGYLPPLTYIERIRSSQAR